MPILIDCIYVPIHHRLGKIIKSFPAVKCTFVRRLLIIIKTPYLRNIRSFKPCFCLTLPGNAAVTASATLTLELFESWLLPTHSEHIWQEQCEDAARYTEKASFVDDALPRVQIVHGALDPECCLSFLKIKPRSIRAFRAMRLSRYITESWMGERAHDVFFEVLAVSQAAKRDNLHVHRDKENYHRQHFNLSPFHLSWRAVWRRARQYFQCSFVLLLAPMS